ncbi:glutaredoxin family protein [Herminiimonas aquatilis]|uniref:Glutaredoxin family protein n=1 Tax=Herminiimonas aquatilis TaxID=345342 RepID=A0ABW2J5J9_9BURK
MKKSQLALPNMTRICPKCSYVRKPTDEAPEWQCPSCQVAYVKASGEAVSANYGRYATPVAKNKSTSAALKWAVILAIFGAGLYFGKPFWADKQASVVSTARAAQPEVTLYATEWCGYCAAARQLFDANGIAYTELDVEKSSAGYEGHKKLNGNGVPLIVIGDKVIRGYSEGEIRSSLQPWLNKT